MKTDHHQFNRKPHPESPPAPPNRTVTCGVIFIAFIVGLLGLACTAIILLLCLVGRADGAEVVNPQSAIRNPQSTAGPSERLWAAQVEVESGGDPNAYKPDEKAAGIVQIRPINLLDCNRIARRKTPWIAADRFDVAASRAMWRTYLAHYGRAYRRETGRQPTDETYARIWNGGPDGWRQKSTDAYWLKVRAALNTGHRPQGNI